MLCPPPSHTHTHTYTQHTQHTHNTLLPSFVISCYWYLAIPEAWRAQGGQVSTQDSAACHQRWPAVFAVFTNQRPPRHKSVAGEASEQWRQRAHAAAVSRQQGAASCVGSQIATHSAIAVEASEPLCTAQSQQRERQCKGQGQADATDRGGQGNKSGHRR